MNNIISVDGFRKHYQEEYAVDNLSFGLEAGQVMGLIGPNGAGKTTTLRAIAGILPASGGSLCVEGFNVESDPVEVKRRTAYVPDDPQLFNDMSVVQHFAFTASVYNVLDWEVRMNEILDRFDLLGKRNARASDLSRGMRQKLAIGCAYLYQPMALLLDEPMTGLDPKGIRVLKETIAEQSARGAAIVISSHLLAMVEDICSHVLILQSGIKKFDGDLASLKRLHRSESKNESLEEIFFHAITP